MRKIFLILFLGLAGCGSLDIQININTPEWCEKVVCSDYFGDTDQVCLERCLQNL